MPTGFLNRINIRQRIYYLIAIVAISVVSVVAFVFIALSSIESQYQSLQDNATVGAMQTLEPISRCTCNPANP